MQNPIQLDLINIEKDEIINKYGSLESFAQDVKKQIVDNSPLFEDFYIFILYLSDNGERIEGDNYKFVDITCSEEDNVVILSFIFEDLETKKTLTTKFRIGYTVLYIMEDGSEVSVSHITDPGESFETMKNEMFRFFLTLEVDPDFIKFPTKEEIRIIRKSDLS